MTSYSLISDSHQYSLLTDIQSTKKSILCLQQTFCLLLCLHWKSPGRFMCTSRASTSRTRQEKELSTILRKASILIAGYHGGQQVKNLWNTHKSVDRPCWTVLSRWRCGNCGHPRFLSWLFYSSFTHLLNAAYASWLGGWTMCTGIGLEALTHVHNHQTETPTLKNNWNTSAHAFPLASVAFCFFGVFLCSFL